MKLAQTTGQDLYRRAKTRIPGGTQLLSKRPEMFLPDQWPSYYASAKGVEVRDLDGRVFHDMSYSGVGACLLGYADGDVNQAVAEAVAAGSMCTLNAPEEVELAELLCELHPWADMVRYSRCGGEAMSIAVRIARAATGRDIVAFCGYHGWHDWYLAANLGSSRSLDGHLLPGLDPAGVPRGLTGTALPFTYNNIEELRTIVRDRGTELAAIVMEPLRDREPDAGFLEGVRALASECGAVLIFDEVSMGWRLTTGGAHLRYGVMPDIAVFAKAISNGYPMAAIIGRSGVMQAAQISFISSTYWTDRVGPAAALATIRKMIRVNVPAHVAAMGEMVKEGWRTRAAQAGLAISISGLAPLPKFTIAGEQAQAARTLFSQEMLDRGYLATNYLYLTYAHRRENLEPYLAAAGEAFAMVARALRDGDVESALRGPVAHTGFRRLT